MSWLEAIDGSIKKWGNAKSLLKEITPGCNVWTQLMYLSNSPCSICSFNESESCCTNCIVVDYCGCTCSDSREWDYLKTMIRAKFPIATTAAIDNILTRLNELKYWVRNVREVTK